MIRHGELSSAFFLWSMELLYRQLRNNNCNTTESNYIIFYSKLVAKDRFQVHLA